LIAHPEQVLGQLKHLTAQPHQPITEITKMARKAKETNPVNVLAEDSILDVSGAWYNPEKSGWGAVITNYGEDTHSVAIYTYDTRGNQVWMVGVTNRGDLDFSLVSPTASGPFDQITNKVDRPAGAISFDLVEPGKMSFNATIRSAVLYPGPQFSPPPPEFITFEGVVTKI
jgi:hypothetical protein